MHVYLETDAQAVNHIRVPKRVNHERVELMDVIESKCLQWCPVRWNQSWQRNANLDVGIVLQSVVDPFFVTLVGFEVSGPVTAKNRRHPYHTALMFWSLVTWSHPKTARQSVVTTSKDNRCCDPSIHVDSHNIQVFAYARRSCCQSKACWIEEWRTPSQRHRA